MIKIVVDLMGGDSSPTVLAKGAAEVLKRQMEKDGLLSGQALTALKEVQRFYDFNSRWAAVLPGAKKAAIKAHGAASADAVCASVMLAEKHSSRDLNGKIKCETEKMNKNK